MNRLAIVIAENFETFESKLYEEVQQIIEQHKTFDDVFFYVSNDCLTDKCVQNVLKIAKFKVNVIKSDDHSPVDIVYKTKQLLDAYDIIQCYFIVSQDNHEAYETACKALFPPIYNTFVQILKDVHCSNVQNQDLSKIVEYLHSISSFDGKQVAIFKSKQIPNQFIHGYSSRQGGISTHPGLASLNLCYSLRKRDSKAVVMENRSRLAEAAGFKPEMLHLAKAVHGNDVWVYEENEPESYDAIVTRTPGVTVAAPGADCNMLLFADPVTQSCGAAHAGWKGLLCGIVEATVNAMVKAYGACPKDLIVSFGPSLSSCCCEFGVEESKKFLSIDKKCVIWKENAKKPFLDLRLAAKILLLQCGVKFENIDDGKISGSVLDICTKCDPDRCFFSYRRIGSQFGNQIGFIGFQNSAILI